MVPSIPLFVPTLGSQQRDYIISLIICQYLLRNIWNYAINDMFLICTVMITKLSKRFLQNILIIGVGVIILVGIFAIHDHFRDTRTEHFCRNHKGTLRETPRGELLCFYGEGKVYPALEIKLR